MTRRTTIRLVPPLQDELSALAEEMGISYNQLVNYALARFVESQKGIAMLEERARRGTKSGFVNALKKADRKRRKEKAETAEGDRIPSSYTREAMIAWLERKKERDSEAS
ncbi:MAG TPA: hypothetical protein VEK15_31115 [Vicinamibacteria bacterium]|nr:hypothetical protein [Vicinamibacteria bacterium]